jgi:polysaccharide chain length determinant protein (PEP-CTERM system associated)
MSNNDVPSTLGDYVEILRRRRLPLLIVIPAALLLAVYLAYTLPASYRSSSTILLEPSSIPEDLVQTTVTSYADQQIELVQRRVMTPENLEAVVSEIDPYPGIQGMSARDKAQRIIDDTVIERVDPITLEVLQESTAFSIHYHNSDPKRAALIAQRISDLFLSYNRRTRAERAEETYGFLSKQAQDIERRISEVDQKISAFKARHGDALPAALGLSQGAAERAERDLQDIEGQIRLAEERQSQLNVQLSKLSPSLGSTTGNWRTELATLQGQLAEARVRYTPDHPDVKRLERQIEILSAKAASETGSAEPPANNPEYLGVRSQINAVQRELAALQASAACARGRIYEYESGKAAAPAVEREFAELSRSRDVLTRQYADMENRLREADIARSLETELKGDRFTQIRTPSAARRPYSPNRIGIVLLGIVLGGGLAVGLAALAESSDPSVRSAKDLREITTVPAIASIPVMLTGDDLRKRRAWWTSYAVTLLAATVFVAVSVATA